MTALHDNKSWQEIFNHFAARFRHARRMKEMMSELGGLSMIAEREEHYHIFPESTIKEALEIADEGDADALRELIKDQRELLQQARVKRMFNEQSN